MLGCPSIVVREQLSRRRALLEKGKVERSVFDACCSRASRNFPQTRQPPGLCLFIFLCKAAWEKRPLLSVNCPRKARFDGSVDCPRVVPAARVPAQHAHAAETPQTEGLPAPDGSFVCRADCSRLPPVPAAVDGLFVGRSLIDRPNEAPEGQRKSAHFNTQP